MTIPLTNRRETGLFLRREAIEFGMSDEDLRQAVRAGTIVRVRHGAYACARSWEPLGPEAKHLVRARSVVLSHDGRVALSHTTGAIAHGLRIWGADLSRVHLVRCDAHTVRSTHDIVYHSGKWSAGGVLMIGGIPVLDAATCAVGVAALCSIESGVVTIDSAYDTGLADRAALAAAQERVRNWPGAKKLNVTMRLAQSGAQSVGESRLRFLCWAGHLPKPVLQYEVRDASGQLVGIADFAWPEAGVLGEFDGRVKYERFLRPGETPADAVFREKRREDAMREATGWRVVRFTWADLGEPRRTIERIRSAIYPAT